MEVCQNHNGDRDLLSDLIAGAADNGADFVKIQSMWSADLTKRDRFENGAVDSNGKTIAIKRPHDTEFERLAKLDLSLEDHIFFIEECKKHGVIPMTTVFARHRVPQIGKLPWPRRVVKVASYDCASLPMLGELAEYFDEFIVSTGATHDGEIEKTAEYLRGIGKQFSFLHCVTSYPNSLSMAHLSRMEWLRKFTPDSGWSDHSLVERDGIKLAKIAIMLGARYVERHLTILPAGASKDGPISIMPAMLKELSDFRNMPPALQKEIVTAEIPEWREALGVPSREMTETELLNRDYYRGRFASPDGNGGWIDNWEKRESA